MSTFTTVLHTLTMKELENWASRPFHKHFTNDIWWWLSEDGEKVVRPEIFQNEETGEYEEDFGYNLSVDDSDEEEEPYCFKDTTIDTVENDICFCSVGGCVKPTEFD